MRTNLSAVVLAVVELPECGCKPVDNGGVVARGGAPAVVTGVHLTLSVDHRLIDGKEAVSFLVTIKELVEDPSLLLLDL